MFAGSVQEFAFLPCYIRVGCFQILAGLLDAASARGSEWNDGLALEVISLHEGVDDGRSGVPPLSIPVNRGCGVSQRGIVICIPGLGQPLIKGLQILLCEHALRLIVRSAAITNTTFFISLQFVIHFVSHRFKPLVRGSFLYVLVIG